MNEFFDELAKQFGGAKYGPGPSSSIPLSEGPLMLEFRRLWGDEVGAILTGLILCHVDRQTMMLAFAAIQNEWGFGFPTNAELEGANAIIKVLRQSLEDHYPDGVPEVAAGNGDPL